jgi:PleD family two-component response regulator
MLRVTASNGVAVRAEGSDPLDVLALADKRLYLAKRTGRDRIVAGFDENDAG